ncbi:MAG: DinB family protein [Thermoanaerobaculia bacterium]
MKNATTRWLALGLALLALSTGPALAREAVPEKAQEETLSGLTQDLIADFDRTGEHLLALAEAVPADEYGWRPAEGVRTVSEVYMHIVGTNILIPVALGAAPPAGLTVPEQPLALAQEWEKTVTAKDEVIARLRDSIAYAKQAIPQIQDLDTEVNLFFPGSKRAYLLIVLTHAHEHLGQSIAYARSIGVVPPWSAAAAPAVEGEEAEEQ